MILNQHLVHTDMLDLSTNLGVYQLTLVLTCSLFGVFVRLISLRSCRRSLGALSYIRRQVTGEACIL